MICEDIAISQLGEHVMGCEVNYIRDVLWHVGGFGVMHSKRLMAKG